MVVKVRRAMLRERREGAKPNGLMAAVLAIWTMRGREGEGRFRDRYVVGLFEYEPLQVAVLMAPSRPELAANKFCRSLQRI